MLTTPTSVYLTTLRLVAMHREDVLAGPQRDTSPVRRILKRPSHGFQSCAPVVIMTAPRITICVFIQVSSLTVRRCMSPFREKE